MYSKRCGRVTGVRLADKPLSAIRTAIAAASVAAAAVTHGPKGDYELVFQRLLCHIQCCLNDTTVTHGTKGDWELVFQRLL